MLTALLLGATVASVPIHVGRFDPAEFPGAAKVARRMPQAELNRRIEKILASGQCRISGQNKERFDIVVPYAVQMEPTGTASKVVVKEMGCAPVERLVGEVAVELSKAGDFKAKHNSGTRWYVSEVYFSRVSEKESQVMADQDKVICRAEHDVLGSRTKKARVCRTVSEWKMFTNGREQLRRDISNMGDPKSF